MMAYKSKTPTKEKKGVYEFMEKHKRKGVVSIKKLKKYANIEGLKGEYKGSSKTSYGKKSRMYWYDLKGKRGKKIGCFGIKNKKSPRIVYWNID